MSKKKKLTNRTGTTSGWQSYDSLQWWALIAGLLSAYLMLINLDYVTFWHDEGVTALMAKNLATQGKITGWDGRNLFFGISDKYYAIDHDFNILYPPWSALPSALGFLLFGQGEFGARIFHALFGVLCLPLLWLILGMDFAAQRRLRVLAFAMFALSPIIILYMRQGRYYSDAIFFALLAFYCYRRYMQGGKEGWAVGLMFSILIGFFNHFLTAVSFSLALASWHLIFYARQTTLRQWLILLGGGAIVAAVCAIYLWRTGIIGSDLVLEYDDVLYEVPFVKRKMIAVLLYFRDIVHLGWLPLAVVLWGLCYGIYLLATSKSKKSKKLKTLDVTWRDNSVTRWAVMLVLLILFSALLSVQPVHSQRVADLRYMVMALPFTMLILARCADWAFSLNKPSGFAVTAILMLTNFATLGVTYKNVLNIYQCDEKGHYRRFPLVSLIAEVHQPYASAIQEAVDYLRDNAQQDDTVFVRTWQESALLQYYVGDLLKFCCGLTEDTSLPKEKLRALDAPIFDDILPDYIVLFSQAPPSRGYDLVYRGETFFYPTQRPEMEFHCFHEIKRSDRTVEIYKQQPHFSSGLGVDTEQ